MVIAGGGGGVLLQELNRTLTLPLSVWLNSGQPILGDCVQPFNVPASAVYRQHGVNSTAS